MCGIAGIYGHSLDRATQELVVRDMVASMQHRGPDGWGTFTAPGCALGHARLSIIDIQGGNQPLETGRFIISYNGEVYNYLELREELKKRGVVFNSRSDTEVIVRAFEAYGEECFSKFNGQFAFILWDKKEKRITIARDRYGVRPLYILEDRGCFYFASEMKAFDRIPGFSRAFDRNSILTHALVWNTLGETTVFERIRSLPAGTFEVYEGGARARQGRYYEIGESAPGGAIDYQAAKEEFMALLADAVRLRLRSDVPVGAYLSGGIDSSVISYLTRENNNERFKTFSVGFTDREFDESAYQNEMVARLNTEHHMTEIDYAAIDGNYLDACYHFERPVFRTAPVPLFLLSRAVRENDIKVVLTGEAADEILYGYDAYKELVLLDTWRRRGYTGETEAMIRQLYPHLQHYADPKRFGFLKMYYEEFVGDYDNELAGLNIRTRNNAIMANIFNREWGLTFDRDALIEEVKKTLPRNYYAWSLMRRNQFLEMRTLLSGYLLSSQGDRMSMAHGVEGRYPFLDHRLVEKLFYYDDSFKLNGFSQKFLLRDAFRGIIPDSILDRPKKPYTAPDLQSFHQDGRWTESAGYFLSPERIKEYGVFDPRFVERFMKKFDTGLPAEIGYRDNMIISFVLSAQMIQYWIRNPREQSLRDDMKTVEISDAG